jgi:hypothetical protein
VHRTQLTHGTRDVVRLDRSSSAFCLYYYYLLHEFRSGVGENTNWTVSLV